MTGNFLSTERHGRRRLRTVRGTERVRLCGDNSDVRPTTCPPLVSVTSTPEETETGPEEPVG